MNAQPKTVKTHRPLYRVTLALMLSLTINVALFGLGPLLLDRQIISIFSRHALLNLMMPLQPKPPQPERKKPEPLEEPPELKLTPLKTELNEPPPPPPEITPPELKVPPLSPPSPSLNQVTTEMPRPKIDMKSLSAASVPIPVNVHPTFGKIPQIQASPGITENRSYGMGEVDSKPGVIGQALPPYPHWARRRGVEGWVKVRFLITAKGRVRDLSILKESPEGVFSKTVLNTVPRWRFKPAKKNGRPVEVRVEQTINFKLDQ